jgi:hypothetical protein
VSNFIAIDLEANGIYAVAGAARGGAKALRAVAWTGDDGDPPPALTLDTAKALGEALREKLKALGGAASAPALVTVGRDRVILKELKHPPVPPAEEPALIRFQAIREMSDSPDDVLLDYVPLGAAPGDAGGERRAMAVMLRKDVFRAVAGDGRGGRAEAGRRHPAAVRGGGRAGPGVRARPRPAAGAQDGHRRGAHGRGQRRRVHRDPRRRDGADARHPGAGAGERVAARRPTAAEHGGVRRAAPGPPDRGRLPGGGRPGWAERLAAALGVPVHAYDPLGAAAPEVAEHLRGRFAGAVGLLAARAAGELPINFAAPRQPRTERDPGKRRLVFAAALAVLLLGVSGAGGMFLKSQTDDAVARLTAERDSLKEKVEGAAAADVKRHDAVDGWAKRRVVYLDELHDLSDRLPPGDTVRITEYKAIPGAVGKDGKQPVQANVAIKVAATAAQPVSELVSAFERDNPAQEKGKPAVNKYYVGAGLTGGGALSGTALGRHTQGFTLKMDVNYREPNKYDRQPKFTPPKKSWGLTPPPATSDG